MCKCLYCGKELKDESINQWHKKCIKSFFGKDIMPTIDLNLNKLAEVASTSISNRKSITGVQQKISLNYVKESNRLTIVGYPLGYIIKPNSKEYPYIAEAEYLVMSMAKESKIDVVMNGLIKLDDNSLVYITKRIDRENEKKIHMEDFCQLSNRPTEYKYSSSCEKLFKIIEKYSSVKNLDKISLFERIVFSFITGNSDMHLKNYSLIYDSYGNHLAKAYDLLPVQVIYPHDTEETALSINGKKNNLRRNDFIKLAISSNIDISAANKTINKLIKLKDKYLQMIKESLLPEDLIISFSNLLKDRIHRLM